MLLRMIIERNSKSSKDQIYEPSQGFNEQSVATSFKHSSSRLHQIPSDI